MHMSAIRAMSAISGHDYNITMGNKVNYVPSIDELLTIVVLDTVSNDQGISLSNFCIQTNTCIVKERVCPLQDSFTSMSHRGKASWTTLLQDMMTLHISVISEY